VTGEGRDDTVSVVVLTKNAGPLFRETLEAVFSQRVDERLEVLLVDSGSTDETLEIARGYPARVLGIEPGEFDHGHTRNLGILHTTGRWIVLLTQDAVPADENWLRPLVEAVRERGVAGAYSRVLPRADASFHARTSVLRDLNARAEDLRQGPVTGGELFSKPAYERRLLANFNNVSSCIRREVWEELPFPRLAWGEDLFWGRAAIEAGYTLRFVSGSVVLHSHEYSLRSIFRRTRVDGEMNKRILDRTCVRGPTEALRLVARLSIEDWRELRRTRGLTWSTLRLAARTPLYHLVEMLGLWRGGRARYRPFETAPVTAKKLRLLFVVHGFPPQTLAGTEIYTLSLLRQLRRRHEVFVLYRAEDRNAENYSLRTSEYQGMPVYEIVNNLEYGGIEETVRNEKIEEKFDWVLDAVRPDVVHFQHCLHLSVSLVSRARQRGIPAFVTLHDYWFVCPKVQLIRPNRRVCETRQPGLVCIECSSSQTRKVRLARWAFRLAPPLCSLAVRSYEWLVRRFPRLRRRMLLDAVALRKRLRMVRGELDAASALISPSSFLKARYVRYGFDPGKILFSRNGLAASGLGRVKRPPSDRLRVAFTGSILWYKGLDVLIRAFNRLDPSRAILRIHGDYQRNPLAREHQAELARWIETPAIRFEGAFRNDRIADVYAETDVLVVPSIWFENSPITIQEAFAARTPVVASRLGAMVDLIHDGKNGLLFEPGNAEDLAAKLERLLDEPGLLERLREGIPAVKTIEENARELETLYRSHLVSEPSRSKGHDGVSLPLQEFWGSSFSSSRGEVRIQGREFALLLPAGERGSSVSYELRNPNGVPSHSVEVETELLEGESDVLLGGSVTLNGSPLGKIPPHAWDRRGPRRRRHGFPCELRAGNNCLEIHNGDDRSDTLYHLRIKRVLVFARGEGDRQPQ